MAGTLLLVNMIPKSLSGEEEQDSEPMLTVNPNNPQQLVGTAFTPNPMGGNLAPVYISADGGQTWTLNAIVPADGEITGDITVAFGPQSNNLYASILKMPQPQQDTELRILRAKNFQASTPMQILVDRTGTDQPFVQASTSNGASAMDRVYVGDNDFN